MSCGWSSNLKDVRDGQIEYTGCIYGMLKLYFKYLKKYLKNKTKQKTWKAIFKTYKIEAHQAALETTAQTKPDVHIKILWTEETDIGFIFEPQVENLKCRQLILNCFSQ